MGMPWITKCFERIDRLILFDPTRWPHREALSRATALTITAAFLLVKIYQFGDFPQTFATVQSVYGAVRTAAGEARFTSSQIAWIWGIRLAVWVVETAILLGYIAAYAGRAQAREVARGFMETAFPIAVAGTPVVIVLMPYNLWTWLPMDSPWHHFIYPLIMTLIAVGGLINLIGLLTLRRAFTIMTEARELIERGIFRYVRHPLYCGHFVMFFGSLLLRLHIYTIFMFALFVWGQVIRARYEERKLLRAFPRYAVYRERVGMFFPRIWRIK
jgi:protein-S-isoprenylcysteine O-methyltransferase Ste14